MGLEPETCRANGDLAYGGVGDLTLDPGAENDADDPVAEDAQPTAIALNPEPVEGVPPAATAPACARSRGGGRTTRGDGDGPRLILGQRTTLEDAPPAEDAG